MISFRQILRQPLKSILGILLVTIGISVFCVGVGQAQAAKQTQRAFEKMFTTTAVPTLEYQYTDWIISMDPFQTDYAFSPHIPDDVLSWLESLPSRYPQIVKTVARPGLASAYLPELDPINHCQTMGYINVGNITRNNRILSLGPDPTGAPYSCALLEITVTGIGSPSVNPSADTNNIILPVTGIIENVVGLQEGYSDPTGYTADLTVVLPDMDSAERLELHVGDRYLVFGMDYYDCHWELVTELSVVYNSEVYIGDVYHDRWYIYNEEELADPELTLGYAVGSYKHDGWHIKLRKSHLERYKTIKLTLQDWGAFYPGQKKAGGLSPAEYRERYTTPTLIRLEGSCEDFLRSEEGASWAHVLELTNVNNHVFPIAGIQDMSYVTEFARDGAEIISGRTFSQEELDDGSRVCIISSTLAEQNGLDVGDVIVPQFYNYDITSPYQCRVEDDVNVVTPTAYYYSDLTPIVSREPYTIVGIYAQDILWRAPFYFDSSEIDPLYTFTPNTVFVPINAVPSDMAYGKQGFFWSLILENGMLEDMKRIEAQAGYSGLLSYYDQGYSIASKGLFNYSALSELAVRTGIVVYCVVLFLFLLLYPGKESKTVATMRSLGTPRAQRVIHILLSSISILFPATLLGITFSGVIWKILIQHIASSEQVAEAFCLNIPMLCSIGVIQFLAAVFIVAIIALWKTAERPGLRKEG